MKTLLLIIDLQQAFINENTKSVVEKIDFLLSGNKYDDVIFTRFINFDNSIWVKKLNYKECISEESKRIIINSKDYTIIDKRVYSAFNEELKKYIEDNEIERIDICGLDTECCVLKTAFDLFENEYNVYVLKDYCACMHGVQRHNNAIEILKRNIGYDKVI